MEQKTFKPLIAADYLTCGGLNETALGDVVSSLVSGDVKKVANISDSVQIIASGISASLEIMAESLQGRSLDKAETTRLTEVLYLMSSLSQLCSNASCAVEDAQFRIEGGRYVID